MKQTTKIWEYRLLQHTAFWGGYWLFVTITSAGHSLEYLKEFIRLGGAMIFKMIATYITLYVFFPRFLLKKKYIAFFSYFFSLLFAFAFLQLFLNKYYIYPAMGYIKDWTIPFAISNWLKICLYTMGPMTLASSIKLLKLSFAKQKKLQELQLRNLQLQKEKSDAELNFLRGQVNPHFLLNTLNGLYSLALHNSVQTAEMISKLADLLKYTLYESNAALVSLEQEITYIENYLTLEHSRYGERLEITVQVSELAPDMQIAPLLLLPFVENAIKHGVSQHTQQAWIHLRLQMEGDTLVFYMGNSKTKEEKADLAESTQGIGLKNVQRRLALLYPERHTLTISNQENTFEVFLEIQLQNPKTTQNTELQLAITN